MGKKKMDVLKMQRQKFIEGARNNGIDKQKAGEVFDYLEPFGRYAFNRSHTVAYAIMSYQTAYLKTHYPREFMASMMSGESGSSEKIVKYIAECRQLSEFLDIKMDVLPPDVNSSGWDFTVDGEDIRFGLAAVKNVNEGAIESIVKTREKDGSFTSLQDFCERVDAKAVSKRVIESLIMAGAFDSFEEGHRAQHFANLEQVMRVAQSAQADREKGQMNLFGAAEQELPVTEPVLDEVSEWEHNEVLKNEKEQLGFYLSGHPLEAYDDVLDNFTTATSQTLAENPNGAEVYVAGQISSFRLTKTKKSGESMAILVVEDLEGVIDVVVFPEAYKISQHAIEEGNFVWIRGTVSLNRQQTRSDEGEIEEDVRQIQASEILPIGQVESRISAVEVTIPEADIANQEKMERLRAICNKHGGDNDLILRLAYPRYGEVIAQCSPKYNVSYEPTLVAEVEALFGHDSIKPSNRTTRVGERTNGSSVSYV
jgi:DNA polymerase-3 subunit alpha